MSYSQRSLLNLLAILLSRSTDEKIDVGKNMRSDTLAGFGRIRKMTKNRAFPAERQESGFWRPICSYWMEKGEAFPCPFFVRAASPGPGGNGGIGIAIPRPCKRYVDNIIPDRRQYSTIREDGAESLQDLSETAGLPKYLTI